MTERVKINKNKLLEIILDSPMKHEEDYKTLIDY